jgi:hypothetical protein
MAGTAGYQRPLVFMPQQSGSVDLIGRHMRASPDGSRPASADGAPEGIDESGLVPGDSGQSDAVRLD